MTMRNGARSDARDPSPRPPRQVTALSYANVTSALGIWEAIITRRRAVPFGLRLREVTASLYLPLSLFLSVCICLYLFPPPPSLSFWRPRLRISFNLFLFNIILLEFDLSYKYFNNIFSYAVLHMNNSLLHFFHLPFPRPHSSSAPLPLPRLAHSYFRQRGIYPVFPSGQAPGHWGVERFRSEKTSQSTIASLIGN